MEDLWIKTRSYIYGVTCYPVDNSYRDEDIFKKDDQNDYNQIYSGNYSLYCTADFSF